MFPYHFSKVIQLILNVDFISLLGVNVSVKIQHVWQGYVSVNRYTQTHFYG